MTGAEVSRRWRLLSPSRLRTVLAVVEHGSVRDAAAALGCTTSSVYQHLALLERGLRTPLVGRRATRAAPTAAGRRLADHAREVLRRLERIEQEMADYGAARRGALRIVADCASAERLLAPLMVRIARDRPLIEVRAEVAGPSCDVAVLARQVRDAECDLVLSGVYGFEPRPQAAGLDVVDLHDEEVKVVLRPGHPAAAGGRVDLTSLAHERWVAAPAGTASARCLDEMCAAAGFAPDVAFRAADWPVRIGLVRAGLAVGVTPRPVLGEDRSVTVRPVSGRAERHRVVAVTRRGDNPATAYVRDLVSGVARELDTST